MPTQKLTPVQRALAHFDDSPTKMASALGAGVLRQHVEHWRQSGRIPTEHCRAVHNLTNVKCWELRPADWSRIWPDLIGTKGAPKVPLADEGGKAKPDAAHAAAARATLHLKRGHREPRQDLRTDKPSSHRGR